MLILLNASDTDARVVKAGNGKCSTVATFTIRFALSSFLPEFELSGIVGCSQETIAIAKNNKNNGDLISFISNRKSGTDGQLADGVNYHNGNGHDYGQDDQGSFQDFLDEFSALYCRQCLLFEYAGTILLMMMVVMMLL